MDSSVLNVISVALHTDIRNITDIEVLKKGMTNRSFLFSCNGQKYIIRIPGEGTQKLINRQQEAAVYGLIAPRHISDEVIKINPESGYKITKFWEDARVCDCEDESDIRACMKRLRTFHEMDLKAAHEFGIFDHIDYYETLWQGNKSVYEDYETVKSNVFSLKPFIEKHVQRKCLSHIDAVPDNFLILSDGDVRLIDWEYAAMQDPHVDLAMFCIYALYDRSRIDRLLDIYFEGTCNYETRMKIYCYIAACGLLWSNWCEYKKMLGVEFGEYALRQYSYAKDFYQLVRDEMGAELI